MIRTCTSLYAALAMVLASLGGALLISIPAATPVQAAIQCDGENQIIRGVGAKPSPFCEAEYLATVARAYGVRVSGSTLRNNINRRARLCRFIGHDSRIAHICGGFQNENRRFRIK